MKNSYKIIGSIVCCMMVTGFFFSCKGKGEKSNTDGVLSYLNFSESDYSNNARGHSNALSILAERGYLNFTDSKHGLEIGSKVRFYDTLDAMLMALHAGEICTAGGFSHSTAKYLISKDSSIQLAYEYNFPENIPETDVVPYIAKALAKEGFAFMLMKENEGMRDQFNAVIDEMQKDGTLNQLIQTQITDVINGAEILPIKTESKPERDTIKVAVTGDLPPMDYVAPDGTFAGFNTAVLAEIGKRLNKNIEMVQVSSVARAAALASGTVDVVFWTRTNVGQGVPYMSKIIVEGEDKAAMDKLRSGVTNDRTKHRSVIAKKDMPDNTIVTKVYFADYPCAVMQKK